nr:MAG: hypothetical protein [Apis mellifra filamentous-like virus]
MLLIFMTIAALLGYTAVLYGGQRENVLTQKWRLLKRATLDEEFDRNYQYYRCDLDDDTLKLMAS